MKRSLSLFAAAFALALTATAQSQADPFSYTYNWSASPIAISAGTGGVTLTNGTPITTSLETDTAATNLTVFSAASSGSPDVIATPASGSNYSLAVTLTDSAGSGTATVTFTGLLLGQLTHDSSTLTNTITGSRVKRPQRVGPNLRELSIGDHVAALPFEDFACKVGMCDVPIAQKCRLTRARFQLKQAMLVKGGEQPPGMEARPA